MIVLVSGGRNYNDRGRVFECLDRFHAKHTISLLIHGQARGADALARAWADERGIAVVEFPANWTGDGRKAAGPIRNRRMVELIPPAAVIAFPGGTGTADMVSVAQAARINVWKVEQ